MNRCPHRGQSRRFNPTVFWQTGQVFIAAQHILPACRSQGSHLFRLTLVLRGLRRGCRLLAARGHKTFDPQVRRQVPVVF